MDEEIPRELLTEVKNRADLVAIVSRRVDLRREGDAYVGRCPLHQKPMGTLKVFPDKRWKCFECGAGGDVFAFVQKVDRVRFPQAVRSVAAAVGVAVPERQLSAEQKRRHAMKEALRTPLETAAEYWSQNLVGEEAVKAREFLAARGLSAAVLEAFRVGYAEREWHSLMNAMAARGQSLTGLLQAGLLIDKGGYLHTYDRFRDRVVLPFAAADGRVIGFGARLVDFNPEQKGGGKYALSAETVLFRRDKALFGLHQALESIRAAKAAVVAHGFLDVLALHQVGVRNAVAPADGSLTGPQLEELRALGVEQVTLFAPPAAAHVVEAALVVLRSGVDGQVIPLPSPVAAGGFEALVAGRGPDGMATLLRSGRPLTEWLMEEATVLYCGGAEVAKASAEQRARAVRWLAPYVAAVQDATLQNLLLKRIARRFDLDVGVLRAELERARES